MYSEHANYSGMKVTFIPAECPLKGPFLPAPGATIAALLRFPISDKVLICEGSEIELTDELRPMVLAWLQPFESLGELLPGPGRGSTSTLLPPAKPHRLHGALGSSAELQQQRSAP